MVITPSQKLASSKFKPLQYLSWDWQSCWLQSMLIIRLELPSRRFIKPE